MFDGNVLLLPTASVGSGILLALAAIVLPLMLLVGFVALGALVGETLLSMVGLGATLGAFVAWRREAPEAAADRTAGRVSGAKGCGSTAQSSSSTTHGATCLNPRPAKDPHQESLP